MSGKVGPVVGAIVGVAAIGGLLYLAFAPVETVEGVRPDREDEVTIDEVKVEPGKKSTVVAERTKRPAKPSRRPVRVKLPPDWYEKLPSRDRTIAKRIQDAQDADNQAEVLAAADAALDSKNDEVRQAAVDALSLQGEAAIPHLLGFIADANKEVSDSAYHAWDDAVDGMEGDHGKLAAVKQVLTVAKDGEHIESAVGKIEMFDRSLAIRSLAKLAQDEGQASAAARKAYENVTGEPFENWAAAELKAMAVDRENVEDE